MKYLAVDYGTRRVGIAASDPGGIMAFPCCTLRVTTRARLFAELAACLERENPDAIVVGLPLRLDGTESLTTRQARNFVRRLKHRAQQPVFWMDELLSTHEARQDLHAAGKTGTALTDAVDQQAACRILERFLAQAKERRVRA
jgi:putative Holliday junction resolvase